MLLVRVRPMNKLAKLIKRLLVIARAPDVKYLIGLNLQVIQKIKGKPGPNDNPREFYQALQQEATKGPLFTEATLKFIDKLDLELTKDEVKWIATEYQKKAKIELNTLRNVLDYLRAEKPDLSKLSYQKAVQNSIQWHEQFKGKADSTGEYNTKQVILKLDKGYTWVEVPVEDLKTEGDNMGHCVGGDDYITKVENGRAKIYSLRDNNNQPHVTIEIDSKDRVIQVQGKENKEPIEKYHAFICRLLEYLEIGYSNETAKYISDPEKLLSLIDADDFKVSMKTLAAHPKLPVEAMRHLAKDSAHVRQVLARNPSIPLDVMLNLARDEDYAVRYSLAANPSLPLDLIRKLAEDERVYPGLAENPNLPLDIMKKLAKDTDTTIRNIVARNPKIPSSILLRFTKDLEPSVRYALAGNPALPNDIALILLEDPSSLVRSKLVHSPVVSLDILKRLADDDAESVRMEVTINPRIPVELMRVLSQDTAARVRASLVHNVRITDDLLEKLASDPSDLVNAAAERILRQRRRAR
jgi:hypothetical protein